jgi:hypothetical protein
VRDVLPAESSTSSDRGASPDHDREATLSPRRSQRSAIETGSRAAAEDRWPANPYVGRSLYGRSGTSSARLSCILVTLVFTRPVDRARPSTFVS